MTPTGFKKDYYGGALMTLLGLIAAYAGYGYRIGTLDHMGPGFFPVALGVLLAITGVMMALAARGNSSAAPPMPGHDLKGLPDLRGGICIVLGTVAFIAFGHYLGLVPATFTIVFICGLGDRANTAFQSLMLALAMSGIAVVVFWWALQMQLPLFTWNF